MAKQISICFLIILLYGSHWMISGDIPDVKAANTITNPGFETGDLSA